MLTISPEKFLRGDVEEKSDGYGKFIVVKSVVEYELDVKGIEQLSVEVRAAGDTILQTYLNGARCEQGTVPVPRVGMGRDEAPQWLAAGTANLAHGADRAALVLRHVEYQASGIKPRRVYEIRLTTTKGSGVARLGPAERKPWDYFSWLLERYPIPATLQESPELRPREPFRYDKALPVRRTDYPDGISSDKYGYQAGNLFFRYRHAELTPSLGRFVFEPCPTPEGEKEKVKRLVGDIGKIEVTGPDGKPVALKGVRFHFRPSHIEMEFEGPGVRVAADSAVAFDDMLEAKITMAAERPSTLLLSGAFNLPGRWQQESGLWLGQTVFYFLLGLDVKSTGEAKTTVAEKPLGYRVEVAPTTKAELVVRLRPGYRIKDIRDALLAQRESPVSVAERSRQEFQDYFARVVPPFACSDQRLADIYHYVAYAVRLNIVDVPFEPYPHPYLTYSKPYFGEITMWAENVATDMLFLRWLNDKSLTERILRKALFHHSTPPLQPSPASFKENCAWDYRNTLTAYEFAKCSDNRDLFDLMKRVVRATAEKPLEHPFEEGALDAYDHMLPQYDYSLRYKPFTAGKVWPGSRMSQPLAHVEVNFWRYQLHRLAAVHARSEGDAATASRLEAKATAIRDAINRQMWDDRIGFYFDYAVKDRRRSDVMSVAAFSALWADVADRAKADRLVAHLTDPKEFWSRFVVPATSLADPRTNPRGYTDGGILLDVNNWFPFQGLLRMGYREAAVELFRRTMDLMTAHGIRSWACDNFTADDGTPMGAVCPDAGVAVDMILRCATGFVPRTDDLFEFDPLILGPKLQSMDWGPYLYKKHWIEVHWRTDGDATYPAGLTVAVGEARFHAAEPGHILLRLENGALNSVPITPDPLEIKADYE